MINGFIALIIFILIPIFLPRTALSLLAFYLIFILGYVLIIMLSISNFWLIFVFVIVVLYRQTFTD